MGKFLEAEKAKQIAFKNRHIFFSTTDSGMYRNKPREFCVPQAVAEENLYAGIRNAAIHYFRSKRIKWHQGHNDKPSNHQCDSQVCCVNFLFPFANKPHALKSLLLPIFPDISEMLPVEDKQYIGFEWLGQEDYLKENGNRKKRTRGANATSADAIVLFKTDTGVCQAVLIEWKYTESYSRTSIAISRSGTDRTETYRQFYDKAYCNIDKTHANYKDFFYEPFYQLLRQQLLAQEMECAKELNADIVSVLHIAPEANADFKKITSPNLGLHGSSPTEIWSKTVRDKRFNSVYTEELFGNFAISQYPQMQGWWEYITERYSWLTAKKVLQ